LNLLSPENEKPPAGNLPIWHYMGLEKFLDLITNERIRLVRASLLSDQHELRLPLDQMEAEYYRDFENDEDIQERRDRFAALQKMRERVDDLKDRVYLNCWSIAQYESYALWKIYLGGAKAGVAIKSSVAALTNALKENHGRTAYLSKVNYVDRDHAWKPEELTDHFFINNKSRHYDYEKELRLYVVENLDIHKAWLQKMLGYSSIISLEVDAAALISEIYLSPFVRSGFRKTMEEVIRKVNPKLTAKICNSAVSDS